jgi:hypothetical protein
MTFCPFWRRRLETGLVVDPEVPDIAQMSSSHLQRCALYCEFLNLYLGRAFRNQCAQINQLNALA